MKARAALFDGPTRPLHLAQIDVRDPEYGEVLVKTDSVGICGTDLFFRDGRFPLQKPSVLGHEASGDVVAVGAGVSESLIGARVVVTDATFCGECSNCLTGRMSYCRGDRRSANHRVRLSHDGTPMDQYLGVSALAEYMLVDRSSVLEIPDSLSYAVGALLGCCCTVALAAVGNVARPTLGESAVVFGAGGVGLSAVRGLALSGCADIVAVDLEAHRLDVARSFGATLTIQAGNVDVVAKTLEAIPGGVDISIETVGSVETTKEAFQVLAPAGRCVVIGMVDRVDSIPLNAGLLRHGRSLQGTVMGSVVTVAQIPRFARLIETGRFDAEQLVSARWPLEDVNDAFEAARARQGIRHIVKFR